MSKALENLAARAAATPKRIVLAEGGDDRVIVAAIEARDIALAEMIVLGPVDAMRAAIAGHGASADGITLIDPESDPRVDDYAARYYELRRHRGVDPDAARAQITAPLNFANMMVAAGDADGSVAGCHYTTADTVRAALQIIGPAPGVQTVSSFFLMVLADEDHPLQGAYVLSDCGLVVDPQAEELSDIAALAAANFAALTGDTPRVAMLSFTTSGSASHHSVDKVVAATELLRRAHPELAVIGDVQLDAAVVPDVGMKKIAGPSFKAPANVLIFPNLQAGNIGYKMMERFGRARAIGPILQGLAKPANDLSRGCSAEDVVQAIAVTAVQAQMLD